MFGFDMRQIKKRAQTTTTRGEVTRDLAAHPRCPEALMLSLIDGEILPDLRSDKNAGILLVSMQTAERTIAVWMAPEGDNADGWAVAVNGMQHDCCEHLAHAAALAFLTIMPRTAT